MAARADQALARPFWYPDGERAESVPWMLDLMERVFDEQQPPFLQGWYGDRYRAFALDPDWLASSFVANAEKEAQGSRKLAVIASEAREFEFAASIVSHAEDEARHARMYVAMLKLVFPDALEDETRRDLLAAFPQPGEASIDESIPQRRFESILDDIVQMNIGEVRTRLHQLLLRPVAMVVCPDENRAALGSLLQRILEDEGRHIIYTCRILEDAARDFAATISALYERRCSDFSEITLREVGVGQFD